MDGIHKNIRASGAYSQRGTYDEEETEWLRAIQQYKQRTGRQFLSNCELLALAKSLGYERTNRGTLTVVSSGQQQ